jgi:phage tail-like protein
MPGSTARSPAPGSARPDPVGELRFRVGLPGIDVGHFQECSGLTAEIEVKEYAEGGNNAHVHKLPTRVKYPNLVLKRGVTHEDALLRWFLQTRTKARQVELSVALVEPGGEVVRTWAFAGAYPVKWTGPGLNAGSSAIATEALEVVHQGLRLT